jgi:hypothetical protein
MRLSKKLIPIVVFLLFIGTSLQSAASVKAEDTDVILPITSNQTTEIASDLVENIEASSTAAIIERATGSDDILNSVESDRDSSAIVEGLSGTVQIPTSLDSNPVTIEDEEYPVEIFLPELTSNEAIQTENGTLIYQDTTKSADIAVQPTLEGVRSLIHIKDATAPSEYRFTVNVPQGGKLVTDAEYLGEEFASGEVYTVDEENIIQGVFAPAWAKDANGNPVPTHYIIEGNDLIQVVDFNENTAFPVVADPDWAKIGKCALALTIFVGGNLIAVSKLIKIKKYINALGGFRETARLLVGATTWEERMRVGGTALVSLAAELTGATSVWSACKK